jgi:hypothetical protein
MLNPRKTGLEWNTQSVQELTAEKIQEISSAAMEVRISKSQLTKFKKVAGFRPGDPPEKVDYRKLTTRTRRDMAMNGMSG